MRPVPGDDSDRRSNVYLGKDGQASARRRAGSAGGLGARVLLALAGSRSLPARGGWWSKVADVARPLPPARRRAGAVAAASTACRSRWTLFGMFFDLVPRLPRRAVIFHNVPRLGGWSVHEVAFLYAASAISFASYRPRDRASGRLPAADPHRQLRPAPAAPARDAVPGGRLRLSRCGGSASSCRRSSCSATRCPGCTSRGTAGRVAMLFADDPDGRDRLRCRLGLRASCLSFWTVGERRVQRTRSRTAATSSRSIRSTSTGTWLRRLLAYLIPMAFVCYFPALYILGKPDPLGLPSFLRFASPVAALLAALAAGLVWQLRRPPLPEHRLVIDVEGSRETVHVWRKRGALRRERIDVRAVDD